MTGRDSPLRIVVAGAGMVSRHHLLGWRKLRGAADIVAICDPVKQRAEARAREFEIPVSYSQAEEMLDSERPDAIDIAAGHAAHADLVRAAADRCIHILCQKPLLPDLKAAEALVAEVGARVRFMVHENWRFRPHYRQVLSWLREDLLGGIGEFHLSVRSSGLLPGSAGATPPALVRQPFLAGLPRLLVLELLIHHLDVARCLIGPLRVRGAALRRQSEMVSGEDSALVLLTARNGTMALVSGNLAAGGAPPTPDDRLEIVGTKGRILFERGRLVLERGLGKELFFKAEETYQAGYDAAIAHFVQAIKSEKDFETDRVDNLDTLRLVDEAYRLANWP